MISKAYAAAKLNVLDTDYVECHGTGTPIGDPIEVEAIGRCFLSASQRKTRLMIGASKPNFGHSEAASGLTAIIKAALALDMGRIPPTCGIKTLNPKCDFDARNLRVVQEVEAWPRTLQRVSINSFGYGGANSHAILESLSSYTHPTGLPVQSHIPPSDGGEGLSGRRTDRQDRYFLLPISAATAQALDARVKQVKDAIAQIEGQADAQQLESNLQDLAYTLAQRRSHMKFRHVLLFKIKTLSEGRPEILRFDDELEAGAQSPGPTSSALSFGFVFTGQGAQWASMGKQLLDTSAAFRETIRNLDSILQRLPHDQVPDWTIEQTLSDPDESSQIHHVTRSQPVCTALQIALVDMLCTWGIRPTAVVGHSSGEIAAAYAAGLLSAEQAILVAYFRGVAVGTLQTQGAMMAAGLSPDAARRLVQDNGLDDEVCVACVNAPESVTLSGSAPGIDLLLVKLQEQNIFARKLQTGGRAYHSSMMKEIGSLYENILTPHLSPKDRTVSLFCNSTMQHVSMFSSVGTDTDDIAPADHTSLSSAKYWRRNLEQPVQFSQAVQNMASSGKRLHLVEIGAHSALKGPLQQIRKHMGLDEAMLPYSCVLVRGQDADLSAQKLAGSLFLHGSYLSWEHVNGTPTSSTEQRAPQLVQLPPYPWDYTNGLLWTEPRVSVETRNRPFPRHPLLGSLRVAGNDLDWHWKNQLNLKEIPWLRDHKVETQVVFPAAGYLSVGIEGLSQILHMRELNDIKSRPSTEVKRPRWFEFRNVTISAALVVPEGEDKDGSADPVELHTVISPRALSTTNKSASWFDFSISSWMAGKARVHCVGSIRAHSVDDAMCANTVKIQHNHDSEQTPASYYQKFEQEGLCLGASFQSISKIVNVADANRDRCELLTATSLRPREQVNAQLSHDERKQDAIHPITIDACIQAGIMSTSGGDMSLLGAHLPVSIRECWISGGCGFQSDGSIRNIEDALDSKPAMIEARARKTGVSTHRVDATLRCPYSATPLIHFQDVLVSQYSAKMPAPDGTSLPRQPCLRIAWKPDIQHVSVTSGAKLRGYLVDFVDRLQETLPDTELSENAGSAKVAAILDLVGHKNPLMRVLELGDDCDCKAQEWMAVLDKGTGSQRYQSWERRSLALYEHEVDGKSLFDVVLLTSVSLSSALGILDR